MKRIVVWILLLLLICEILAYTVGVARAAYSSRPSCTFDLQLSQMVALKDEWGRPRRNADGTFYPGDGFKITYTINMTNGDENYVIFKRVEVEYPEDVFMAEGLTNESSGTWVFQILKTAKPGEYTIRFKAYATQRWLHEYEVTVCKTIREKVCEEVPQYDAEGNLIGTGQVCWYEYSEECWKETRYEWLENSIEDIETVSVKIVPYRPIFTLIPSKVIEIRTGGTEETTPTTYLALRYGGDTSYSKPFAVLLRFEGIIKDDVTWWEALWSWITGGRVLTRDRRAVIDGFEWEGEAKTVKMARGCWYDANRNGKLDGDEPVYSDKDGSRTVSPGDVRQTPYLGYQDGSVVRVEDADVGLPLSKEVATKFWTSRKDVRDYPGGENALYLYGSSVADSEEKEWSKVELGVPPLLQGSLIYCRLLYAVDQDVVGQILKDGYEAIWFKVKLTTSLFSLEPIELKILNKVKTKLPKIEEGLLPNRPSEIVREIEIEPEFTYMGDVYAYPIEIRAVKPAEDGRWETDSSVKIEATWIPGIKDPETGEIITMDEIMERWRDLTEENIWGHWQFFNWHIGNKTYTVTMPPASELKELWGKGASYITGLTSTDIQQVYAKPEIEDPVGILIYEYDTEGYGANDVQVYAARGALTTKVRKTSPNIFTLEVTASKLGRIPVKAASVVFLPFGQAKPPDFKVEQPWLLYVNLAGGGVDVEKASAYRGLVTVKLKIEAEAGGIERVEVWKKSELLYSEELPDNIHEFPEEVFLLKIPTVKYRGFGYAGEHWIRFKDDAPQPQTYTLKAYNVWDAVTTIQFKPVEVKPLISFTNMVIYVIGVTAVIILFLAFLRGIIRR
jgi:hypothetical protein